MKQCKKSSWRGHVKRHGKYGPGGFNRCTKVKGHGGAHVDAFGVVFVVKPSFRVLGSVGVRTDPARST